MKTNRRLLLQIGLSILILYHLAAVIILPNSSSLLGRKLGRFFIPYANTFALNTAWVFFSPGPAPMYYLEYEVEKADSDYESNASLEEPEASPNELEKFQYPPRRKSLFDDGYNRRLYEMRFFTLNDERTRRGLIPYLCRKHPEAETITVQSKVERVPDIERAGMDSDFKEAGEKTELPRQTYHCERGNL